jgi:hypothetical protein
VKTRIAVTPSQGVDFVPVSYGSGPTLGFDVIDFKVTNRSLLHPVFLRSVGAEGQGTAGAPAACDVLVQTIRDGRSEQEHIDAVVKLARDFVPRSEDVRSLQASWLKHKDDDGGAA